MAAKSTIKKAVCDICGDTRDKWYLRRKHGYQEGDCGGVYVERELPKEVLVGEFTFVRNYGNTFYLRHEETGREVNIFANDLLKTLIGRSLGTLELTESARGRESCWKAKEVGNRGEETEN